MKAAIIAGTLLLLFMQASALEMEFNIDIDDTNGLPAAMVKAVNQAYDLNMKGLELLDKKNLDEAMKLFDEALSVWPDYDDAINNKGVVLYRKGLISDAQKTWESLASKKPDYAVASYNIGLVYIHEQHYDAAERLFERALKANKSFVEAWVRYGYLQMQTGKKEKGLEALKKAYKISPDHEDAWSFLAYGLILSGDTLGALTILKKKEPNAEALKMHGLIEAALKNYSQATELLSKSVTLGANPSILVELASVQIDNGKCKDALQTLKKYFAMNIAHESDSWLLAGIAAKECNDLAQSEDYFEQGVKNFPQDAILRYNLGQIYFHLDKSKSAEDVWSGMTDTLQDPSLFYLRAMNARRSNKFDDAEKLVKKAISMDDQAEYNDLLGVIYHLKGDDKSAKESFSKALKLNPDLKSAQLNLALITRNGENLNLVIKPLELQLKSCISDTCSDLALQLSILYYHSRMIQKAIDVLLAVKETEKDELIYRHLAIYYKELHEWKEAIATLESAAKRLVLEPQTEYELAESYLLNGMYQKAVERFNILLPKWGQNPWRLYYQIGYAYLEQNELASAKEFFEKSMKSKSDNVAARGLLAFVLNRMGNVADARQLWEKNLKDDPNNPSLWINMGLSYERDGKFSEALEYYKKAAILKNDKELQINVGNAYMGLERYTEAFDAYGQALNTAKRDLAAYDIFLVARKKKEKERAEKMLGILSQEYASSSLTKRASAEMYLWNADTTKALAVLENLSDKDESDWLTLGMLYALKGKKEKALSCLQKVPSEAQFQKAIDNVKAQIAFSNGNYEQALQIIKSSGDTSFVTQYNMALSAYNALKFGDALAFAERLTKVSTGADRADVCRLAGNAAFAMKQWQRARQWYLQLSNMEARNPVVQYNLAVAAYNLNETGESWKYYQRARELDSSIYNKDIEAKYGSLQGKSTTSVVVDTVDMWYNKAVDFQTSGDDSSAEALYKKIVAKDSLYSLAWNNLGAIYGKRGEIDKAEKAYFKAVEKKHDIPESYANLVNLYIELEEFSKARQWIIKGLGHNPDSQILLDIKERIPVAEQVVQDRKKGK